MFLQAVPVFAKGKEKEMNYTLLLRDSVESLKGCKLYVTAASFYRLSVNGRFVAFGPARTAGGYARVDELLLSKYHREGGNEIVIEVAGYACRSLSTVKQDSFVVAELRRGDAVLLATGRDFVGYRSAQRVQRVERYSGQRHFGEVYDLANELFDEADRVTLAQIGKTPDYLHRVVPYPTYERVSPKAYTSRGRFVSYEPKEFRVNRYSFAETMSDYWGYYPEEEVAHHPYRWLQKQKMTHERSGKLPVTLSEGEYVLIDFDAINVGFFEWSAKTSAECEVVLGFSELCSPRKFEFTNMNVQNVIEYRLPADRRIRAHSFEPYAARFAVLMVKKGRLCISSFAMRRFEHDRARLIPRKIRDSRLRRIYAGAETTFLHNALDIYTDCPSRERAGWLCDSYFTARAERFLTGDSRVEDAFLENYRLYRPTGELPDGILPMCFPSDVQFLKQEHPLPRWIPQWNMWYVLEVAEYLTFRRPDVDRELFRESVYGFLRYLEGFENADGLLQDLLSWNFVEWSTANEWVHSVNYPTNFLYAEALRAAGKLYGDADMIEKSARIRATTARLSFDGEVFIDNAVKDENGVLRNTRNSSEAGQYYALLFGDLDITDPKYARLMAHVKNSFADFDATGRGFVPVNAFIGLYLRIWLLMELGERELLAENIKEFFGGMVKSTGTLWEYKQHKGSYDHGFASFVAEAICFVENE